MDPAGRVGQARRLVIGFVAIAGGLTAVLGVLSWRFIALEEDLEQQRIRQRLEIAGDGAVGTLSAGLAESERWLQSVLAADEVDREALVGSARPPLTHDAVVLVVEGDEIFAHPRSALVYYPSGARAGDGVETPSEPFAATIGDARFAEVDALEYRARDFDAAAARLRDLASSEETGARAVALFRLGRVLRRQGDDESALAVYDDLDDLQDAWIEDLPAPLWAGVNRCEVLDHLGYDAELRAAAADLLTLLQSGRWHLTADAYRFYADKAATWLAEDQVTSGTADDRTALAEAVGQSWQTHALGSPGLSSYGTDRSIVWAEGQPFTALVAVDGRRRAILVAGQRFVVRNWVAEWQTANERQGVQLELVDVASGRTLYASRAQTGAAGVPESSPQRVVRTPVETGLPFSLHVTSADEAMDRAGLARQRGLLLVGLTLVVGILSTGVYFIGRAVTREFEAARVQSDFVAAVSHEFRSPLTAMRHMIELLAADRVPDDATRARFYGVLERESHRLQRLVEQLLDFRRLDEGVVAFDMQPFDATDWVEEVAAAFRDDASTHGATLDVSTNGLLPVVRGDRDALSRALWNLLDNALRYSPESPAVWLDVSSGDGQLAVSVRDRGVGIPPHEQATIFRKFVRGSDAQRLGARGTGLGLAMVAEIAHAHGGEVTLDSTPGAGSTFTLLLPLEETTP